MDVLCPRCNQSPLPPAEDVLIRRFAINGQEVCAACFAAYDAAPRQTTTPRLPASEPMIRRVEETL